MAVRSNESVLSSIRSDVVSAIVFNIQRFSLHDGPGIRTIVFFKGCPLNCVWCDNPESQLPVPELGFIRARCDKCGRCAAACHVQAIALDAQGWPQIDRNRCTACGECVKVCYPEALAIYGKSFSVEAVFEEVRRDMIFFSSSGGGVTVSGGEPLLYPSFVVALFRLCREAGISTAVETCGYVRQEALTEVLRYTDFLLYDLKHLDPQEHREFTGKSNSRILQNARLAVSVGRKVLFRMPLIPGVNDSIANVTATAQFVRKLQGEEASIELMPYHTLGKGKYEAVGRTYPLTGIKTPEREYIESVRRSFEGLTVRCLVSR